MQQEQEKVQSAKEASAVAGNLAMFLTPAGEVPVRVDKDGDVLEYLPVPTAVWAEPKGWKPKHHQGMMALGAFIGIIATKNRKVPALRDELVDQMKVPKAVLVELQDLGLIKIQHRQLLRKGTGKGTGARVLVWPTPMGMAYITKIKTDAETAAGGSNVDH